VCCSVLQRVADTDRRMNGGEKRKGDCVAGRCSVLQCVAVCCSVLQAQTAECKVARSGREMCRCKRVSRSACGRWCWRNRRRLGILPAHRERLHVKKRYTHWKRNLRAPKETCVPKKRRVDHRRDILTLRSSSCASGMVPCQKIHAHIKRDLHTRKETRKTKERPEYHNRDTQTLRNSLCASGMVASSTMKKKIKVEKKNTASLEKRPAYNRRDLHMGWLWLIGSIKL